MSGYRNSAEEALLCAKPRQAMKVAYVMSRFPKLTETFVLYEILTLNALGIPVEIYPLLKERHTVAHPEALKLVRQAHYHPCISFPILRAQWHFLRRSPFGYLKLLYDVLRGTWGSANFFFGALGIFPKAVRFAYEMAEEQIEHVHCHFATHPALTGLIIHRLTGIPFSFTAHGSDLHVDRRMLDKKIGEAAFAVTVSQYNKELMVEECGEEIRNKIHVVHCGVDPEVFSPRPKAVANGPFHILTVASFEEVKGHQYLIDACQILRDRGIGFICHLVGDGPLRGKLEEHLDKSGMRSHFCLHGKQPRKAVAALLRQADVFVLPSVLTSDGRREGIPVALMEAMATGLPVVSSAISGIPELVDHGKAGFLVQPRQADALADALETLARDPDLRFRMGCEGRQKVVRQFNLQMSARQILELILAYAAQDGCMAPSQAETSTVQDSTSLRPQVALRRPAELDYTNR